MANSIRLSLSFASYRQSKIPNSSSFFNSLFHIPSSSFPRQKPNFQYSSLETQFFGSQNTEFLIPWKNPDKKLIREGKVRRKNRRKGAQMGLLDLEKHFAFYGAYHSHPMNVVIHMLFVWPIAFFSVMLLYFTPAIFELPSVMACDHNFLVLNYGFVLTVIYSLFYVSLDIKAGSLAALLCFILWVSGSFLSHYLGFSVAWKVATMGQIFCWTGQFIGHAVFEKRAPALLDNLAQALIMAPFFVLFEALQSFAGYEPYPGFHARVKAKIDAEIKEWQEKKQKKLS